MTMQASQRAERLSADWSVDRVRRLAGDLCERVRDRIACYRQRSAAAILYAELSKLSAVELGHRGIARGDLHRLLSEMHGT